MGFHENVRHKIVDFRCSSVSWLGDSEGTFKIASVLRYLDQTELRSCLHLQRTF